MGILRHNKYMAFAKGQTPWNKGKKSPETSRRMKGQGNHRFGKKATDETRKKLSVIRLGEKNHFFGKKHRDDTKEKMRGKNNGNWKGGISTINHLIRSSAEYKLWRMAILQRDNWTCIWCGLKGGWSKELKQRILLEVDHIKAFAEYPELRFAIDNGRTLCKKCHMTTETYGKNLRFKK
jgi:hypothetical protein